MRGSSPGTVRRFRLFPVRRHRFCLLRSPAVVPFASSAPGFGSRGRFSEPLARLFDRVQVSENLVQPELAFRRRSARRSSVPSGSAPSVPSRPAPAPAEFGSSSDGPASTVRDPGLPPGSGLLFRSFAVRFVHGPYLVSFCSFQFNSARFALSLRSCSFPFVLPSAFLSVFRSVFELIPRVAPAHRRFIYIFLAYIIHEIQRNSNVFFIKKHVFFRNKHVFYKINGRAKSFRGRFFVRCGSPLQKALLTSNPRVPTRIVRPPTTAR